MTKNKSLIQIFKDLKIKVYEPFAEFLNASAEEIHFDISLLDCYHLAGHACHSMTGAFLVTKEAVLQLYPESQTCQRGDLQVQLGSDLDESASGPRSNVISYITGAWGASGFKGFKGKFSRNNLISYGHTDLKKNSLRFTRISTNESVVITYDPSPIIKELNHQLSFPESWRIEIQAILSHPDKALSLSANKN